MFNEFLKLYQNKLYLKVITNYDNNELDSRVLEIVGLSALKVQNFELAYDIFTKLSNLKSDLVNYYHLGLACLNRGFFKEAKNAFEKSKNDPKFELSSKLNDIDEANVILSEITKNSPMIQQSWFMLFNLNINSLDLIELSKNLKKSKHYLQNSIKWQKSNALLLYYSYRYIEAIEYIKSVKTDDENLKTILAKCYLKINEYKNSSLIFLEIISCNSKAYNWYNLAAVYSHLTSDSELNKSLEAANTCLKLDKTYHQAYLCKAIVYEKLGDFEKAEIQIRKAIKLNHQDLSYKLKLAEILNLRNLNLEGLTIIDKILKIDRNYILALRLKGIIELQQCEIEKSNQTLEQVIKKDSTDQRALAYYNVTNMLRNPNDVHKAREEKHFVKEFELDPSKIYSDLLEFNKEFEHDIKNHSLLRKDPNGLAAKNGYLTDNLFKDNTRSIATFRKLLEGKIDDYIKSLPTDLNHIMLKNKTNKYKISSWATWMRGDGYIDKHIHEESWISGVYYCSVPDIIDTTVDNEGYLEYGCMPNQTNNILSLERHFIKPTLGKLVIFPSYLFHQTIPHKTTEDRISVAFDLTPLSWIK